MRISDWSSDLCASDLEVLGRRDAALGRRCAKGIEDLPRQALRLDAPLAAAAVAFVAALVVVLRALEVGQDLVPDPAGVAELAPEIIVARLAAHVDHADDRGAAAQHAPARIVQCPPVKPRLRLGLEAPVGARIILRVAVADGHVETET